MSSPPPAIVEPIPAAAVTLNGHRNGHVESKNGHGHAPQVRAIPDPLTLRRWAETINQQKAGDHYAPAGNHTALAPATPHQAFAHWRIQQSWIDQIAKEKGAAWQNCALVLRLYDVSFIEFNGLNAHSMRDFVLPAICGRMFFPLNKAGTWQIAEAGFRLRNGEFVAASRSTTVAFPTEMAPPWPSQEGLLVNKRGQIEEIANVWDQEHILFERRKPLMRPGLKIALFSFETPSPNPQTAREKFLAELISGTAAHGHEVHIFLPGKATTAGEVLSGNIRYHHLDVPADGSPVERAQSFAEASAKCLRELPPFDLVHRHEWMAGLLPASITTPTIFSLTSTEVSRSQGKRDGELFSLIHPVEQQVAQASACILAPEHLRDHVVAELGVPATRVHSFPMEARLPGEWDTPLDLGQVKREIGVGPIDRLLLFVGPLEHGAGPDLLIDALPSLLGRAGSLRIAFVGCGSMHGHLQHRASQRGVAHAVRLLGHVERPQLVRLFRAAEALVLPSRYRMPWDDAVVDLARQAGRPVVTTHSGPSHVVSHDQNGLLTYDNPGSMVWAVDRILHDPLHAQQMGRAGKRETGAAAISWEEVVERYLDLCAASFPELRGAGAWEG